LKDLISRFDAGPENGLSVFYVLIIIGFIIFSVSNHHTQSKNTDAIQMLSEKSKELKRDKMDREEYLTDIYRDTNIIRMDEVIPGRKLNIDNTIPV